MRNILSTPVIIDSTKIIFPTDNNTAKVQLKNPISGHMIAPATEETFDLTASGKFSGKVTGKVRIYYHTANWHDLVPVDFPFCITSQDQVEGVSLAHTKLESYPNPASGTTTIRFHLAKRELVSVKIYDALGRIVRIVKQGVTNAGDQLFEVNTAGLSAGSYSIELTVTELGITERHQMIVIE
jgi:hypothetical protein